MRIGEVVNLFLSLIDQSRLPACIREWTTVTPDQWDAVTREIATALDVPAERITPGAPVGITPYTTRAYPKNDIIDTSSGLIVQTAVKEALIAAGLTGVEFFPIEVSLDKKSKLPKDTTLPDLWLLYITGRAWRVGSTREKNTECPHCGRTWFNTEIPLVVDESRWDGSDFFRLDENSRMMFVTERVCRLLEDGQFSNYQCEPLAAAAR
jgi:hypothetical protein